MDRLVRSALRQSKMVQGGKFGVIVDGQYGSTGKGVAASLVYEALANEIAVVTSNAGPNSGHTSYYGDEKVVLMQLPTIHAHAARDKRLVKTFLNAGAIIDPEVLAREVRQYPGIFEVHVHKHAALIDDRAVNADAKVREAIGGTGKGTGPALASKVLRDPAAVVQGHPLVEQVAVVSDWMPRDYVGKDRIGIVEVSQGYSLGINSGFYPYVTSRECTVSQALSDAGLHPNDYAGSMMVVRTFPIRVHGNSGPCYPDQREIEWSDLGVEPEITTVTKKQRRVFTFSVQQYMDAVAANRPDVVFLNFCNYLQEDVDGFVRRNVLMPYVAVMGRAPDSILVGFGPTNEDVKVFL